MISILIELGDGIVSRGIRQKDFGTQGKEGWEEKCPGKKDIIADAVFK